MSLWLILHHDFFAIFDPSPLAINSVYKLQFLTFILIRLTFYGRRRPIKYGRPLYFHPMVSSSFFFPHLISASAPGEVHHPVLY